MTPAQIMLLDIITDRIITLTTTVQQIKNMTEQEVDDEIAKWDQRRDDAVDKLKSH